MSESSRLDELRRRVQVDPASIAFAALAEEYRRARRYRDAVDTSRAGLRHHPAYVSARVTLGRSLMELRDYEPAERELSHVLRAAPDNLAARRALGELYWQQLRFDDALRHFREALALVPRDSELPGIVRALEEEVAAAAEEARRQEALAQEQTAQQDEQQDDPPASEQPAAEPEQKQEIEVRASEAEVEAEAEPASASSVALVLVRSEDAAPAAESQPEVTPALVAVGKAGAETSVEAAAQADGAHEGERREQVEPPENVATSDAVSAQAASASDIAASDSAAFDSAVGLETATSVDAVSGMDATTGPDPARDLAAADLAVTEVGAADLGAAADVAAVTDDAVLSDVGVVAVGEAVAEFEPLTEFEPMAGQEFLVAGEPEAEFRLVAEVETSGYDEGAEARGEVQTGALSDTAWQDASWHDAQPRDAGSRDIVLRDGAEGDAAGSDVAGHDEAMRDVATRGDVSWEVSSRLETSRGVPSLDWAEPDDGAAQQELPIEASALHFTSLVGAEVVTGVTGEVVPGEAASAKVVALEAVPQEAAPEEAGPKEAEPKEAVTEQSATEQAVAEEALAGSGSTPCGAEIPPVLVATEVDEDTARRLGALLRLHDGLVREQARRRDQPEGLVQVRTA